MTDVLGETGLLEYTQEGLLGLVSDRTKPCVSKAIDYTLLVFLLVLQFMRCSPVSAEELRDYFRESGLNTTDNTAPSIYSCELSNETLLRSLFYSSQTYINVLVMASIFICIIIGFFYAFTVWIHGRVNEDLPIHPWTRKLYRCTDRIFVIDSFLEIPVSFYWAPFMTIVLWSLYGVCIAGLIFLFRMYAETVEDDESAKFVFASNGSLVGLSLFKLTGEVSQYWVLYRASSSEEAREKFDKEKIEKNKRSSRILNTMKSQIMTKGNDKAIGGDN